LFNYSEIYSKNNKTDEEWVLIFNTWNNCLTHLWWQASHMYWINSYFSKSTLPHLYFLISFHWQYQIRANNSRCQCTSKSTYTHIHTHTHMNVKATWTSGMGMTPATLYVRFWNLVCWYSKNLDFC
jgi:hypothetical protein